MSDILKRLEFIDSQATPAPWGEFCESGDWWIGPSNAEGGAGDGISVCPSDMDTWTRQDDIDVTIAARNALPLLLRVARAAHSYASGPGSAEWAALYEALEALKSVKL